MRTSAIGLNDSDFLSEADRRGIIVELTLFSSQYGDLQWNVSPFNRENNVNATDAIDWKNLNTLDNGNINDQDLAAGAADKKKPGAKPTHHRSSGH